MALKKEHDARSVPPPPTRERKAQWKQDPRAQCAQTSTRAPTGVGRGRDTPNQGHEKAVMKTEAGETQYQREARDSKQ